MKPKTFIILSPGFPRDESETTCLPFLQNFVRELRIRIPLVEVVVFAFDYPFDAKSYNWNDIKVIAFNGWKKGNWRKLWKWQKIWRSLRTIKKKAEIIGMLSLWCGECAYFGFRFSRMKGLKHFCWVLGQDARQGNKYVRRIKPCAQDLIAISDFIQDEFDRNYSIRPDHVMAVGIQKKKSEWTNKSRDIDILGAGSLIALKGYDLLIEAVGEVCKIYPETKVVVAGKGPEMDDLKKRIETGHLEKNISLVGELSHDKLLEMMSRAKIFLHPSSYEGLAAVCLEALQAGCHVVSFVRSMNKNPNHWYIVDSQEEMVAKILSLLGDKSLDFESVTTFTMEETVTNMLRLFH
jgi:glycosyltransferase involved in cell wall biosynthesis